MQDQPLPGIRAFVCTIILSTLVLAAPGVASAVDVQATIDFDVENLPPGTIVDFIHATGGENELIGPIGVFGAYPNRPANSAVIFDSAMRTGGDGDLGTPNQTFGGPGIGSGGELGSPHENDTPLGQILIVAEDLYDWNSDGLVDDPDDGAIPGMVLSFDFTTITAPFVPDDVRVLAVTTIDTEWPAPGSIKIYDASGALISDTPLTCGGDNGVVTEWLGTPGFGIPGAATMEVHLHGSSAIDDIVLELTSAPPPSCDLSSPGSSDVDIEVGEAFTLTLDTSSDVGYGDLVVEATSLPAGASAYPTLPASSEGASSIEVMTSWTPTAEQIGDHLIAFLVTDALGQTSTCSIWAHVYCDLSVPSYGQPSSHTVCEGEDVYLHATPHATAPATYTWHKDGAPIPGANTTSLTLTAVGPADAGDYTLVITNPCGTLTSESACVTVKEKPAITSDPYGAEVCEGESATLTVTATGEAPLTYQWKKNGSPISGATDATLTIPSVSDDDAGTYTVKVTNECGYATSAPATLTVRHAPTIYGHPEARTLCAGESTTFEVNASGSTPLSYQWQKDGVDLPGETGTSLTLTDVTPDDSGVYLVIVTNDCGSAECAGGMLTVRTAPSIDAHPYDQTLCEGETLSLHVEASGSYPLSYQWKKDGLPIDGATSSTYTVPSASQSDSGSYTVKVENDCGYESSYPAEVEVRKAPSITTHPQDQTLCEGETLYLSVEAYGSHPLYYTWKKDGVVIEGATGSSLTIEYPTMSDSGSYTVKVENDCGYEVSYPANVEVRKAPQIEQQPQDQVLCEGEMLTLTVVATGSHPLSYQWKKDGVAIDGATEATYTVAMVSTSDAGNYTVRVENDCGYETSYPAYVEVRVAPTITMHPMGQTLCEGDPLLLSVTAEGSHPLYYQWKLDGIEIPGATDATYMVSSVTTANAGTYTVMVSNDCGMVTSDPAEVIVRVAPVIVTQPMDQLLCEGDPLSLLVEATGSDPLEYQWSKDGVAIPAASNPSAITANLMIASTVAADSGLYTVTVTNDCGMAMSDGATVFVRVAPMITMQPMDQTLCEGETISLSVTATGTDPLSYQWKKNGIDLPGETMATLTIPNALAADSGDYTVMVSNACGMVTSDPATVFVRVAPMITAQPMDQLLCEGETISLAVSATGTGPLLYQWKKDGVEVPGATASTLTIPNALAADSGVYTVMVTNACGMVTSDPATVTVRTFPTITTQPTSQDICLGQPVTFTVVATGTAPLSYQWRKNGVAIANANGSTFTIPAVAVPDGGVYTVLVSNVCGDVLSSGATLTVLLPPTITVQPQGGSVCLGDDFTLSVTATGEMPLLYQWRRNGIDLPGQNASTLLLDNVTLADGGTYTVLVSNICGSVLSAPAVVTILTPPTITVHPVGGTICIGDPLNLSVTATGSPTLTYQWFLDGVPITGATSSTYAVPAVDLDDAGSYTVTVTNTCATVTSNAAEVIVATPPEITITPPLAVTLCVGDSTTLATTVTGFPTPTLSWSRNGVPIAGANGPEIDLNNVTTADAGNYVLTATNLCGTDMSETFVVTVRTPPMITMQPVGDDETCPDEGNDFTFTVTATGSAPLSYQWFKDGVPLTAAVVNGNSYTITNVVVTDYGNYTVTVTNDCGSVTSNPAPFTEPAFPFCETPFERGDCNADGIIDIADGIYIMRFSFQGFAGPPCFDACDHNDDGMVNIADTIWVIGYIFMGGEPPLSPFQICGYDEPGDELDCVSFPPCEMTP